MIPANFEESNGVLDPPNGVDLDDCSVLSVWRGRTEEGSIPLVVSCWKPTQAELDEINRTGRVWLMVWGVTMPPAVLSGESPFIQPGEENDHDS